ncbi:MAG: O-antigen ligase family protein [Candidatus Buchananbacteria bacterium]|nr:O-antigen ligase family protein [Candidatus Buchananbacteria bacterium]
MMRLKQIQKLVILSVIFLIPLQTVYILHERFLGNFKWQYGTELLYLTQLLVGLALLLQLVFWAVKKQPLQISVERLFNRQHTNKKILVVLIAWALLSISWAHNQELAWYYFVMLALAIAFGIVVRESKINIRWVAWVFLASGVVQSVLAMWQWGSQRIGSNVWLGVSEQLPATLGTIVIQTADERLLRAYGTFTHPNILGGFLVVVLLAAVWLVITERTKFKLIALITIPIIIFGLGYSFSRSAWIAAIIGILVMTALEFKRNKVIRSQVLKASGIVLISSIAFALLYWPLITIRVQAQTPLETRSVTERLSAVDQSIQIIKRHPIMGVGIGNYTNELSRLNPNQPAYQYQPVHNAWLLVLAELGIVGFILFVSLFVSSFLKSQTQPLVVAILISLFVASLFDHYLWTSWSGLVLVFGLWQVKD